MSNSRRKYDAEFKRNAVMLVESGRSVSDDSATKKWTVS